MGCLNSTSSTRVQPFDGTRDNRQKQASQQQNGHTSQQNGHTSQQNGHIPNSIPNTPRETLGQLPHQNDTYNNNAASDTRIINTAILETEEPESTTVEPISLEQSKGESGLDNEPGASKDQTNRSQETDDYHQNLTSRTQKTDGDQSQRSTNREPVVVPTMPVTEEDLLRTHYTIKEISLHNQSKDCIDIFPLRKNIYSTAKFKEAIKSVVKRKYEKLKEEKKTVPNYDYEDFYEKWISSPIFLVLFKYTKMFIRFLDVKSVLPGCKVAEVFDQGELYEDIIKDSKDILESLKGESNISESREDYKQLLERFLDNVDKVSSAIGSVSESNEPTGQDPNTIEFPLPESIKSNLTVLQKWITTWKPFDTELSSKGIWEELPDNVVNALKDPLELSDICRVSSDGLPDFDFTIEGEAAWDVIELDIVKNDKTTEEQERILKLRENRTDMNDPMFILRKQTRLEMYFINKYEWDSSKLEPFRGFTARLQRGWREFEALVEKDEYTIIPEDEY